MMDQKNLILAIALSVAILLGFQYFFEQPRLQREAAQQQAQQTQQPQQSPATPQQAPGGLAPAAPGAPSVTGAAPSAASRDEAIAAAPRVKIDTSQLHGSIDLIGSRI